MKAKKPIIRMKTPANDGNVCLYYNQGCFHFKLELEGESVIRISFIDPNTAEASTPSSSHPYIGLVDRYLRGASRKLELPYILRTTEFAERVYSATLDITYGQTSTYGTIAANIGSPRASRSVGVTLRNNPLPLIIPCHRVLGANGKLTGFAGGLELKSKLLELEKGQ